MLRLYYIHVALYYTHWPKCVAKPYHYNIIMMHAFLSLETFEIVAFLDSIDRKIKKTTINFYWRCGSAC